MEINDLPIRPAYQKWAIGKWVIAAQINGIQRLAWCLSALGPFIVQNRNRIFNIHGWGLWGVVGAKGVGWDKKQWRWWDSCVCNEHVLDDYRLPLVFSSRNLQTSFYKSINLIGRGVNPTNAVQIITTVGRWPWPPLPTWWIYTRKRNIRQGSN